MNLSGKTTEELLKMRKKIEEDPLNLSGETIFIYTAKARKKLFAIDLQITHNLAEKRKKEGNPV